MKARQQGFTLLEIMIVLSLLGVLLTLVGGALLGANRAVLKAQRYTVSLDEMRAAQQFLRTAISEALPLDVTEDDSQTDGFFAGGPQRMQFVATLPGVLGGGIQRFTLQWVGPESQRDLQVAFARFESAAQVSVPASRSEPQVLLKDVEDLQFSYRGVSPKGQATGWISTWPWTKRLPYAVRIDARVNGPVPWVTQVARRRRRQLQGLHQHCFRGQHQHLTRFARALFDRRGQRPGVDTLGDIGERQPRRQAATQLLEPQAPAQLQQAAAPALGDGLCQRLKPRG